MRAAFEQSETRSPSVASMNSTKHMSERALRVRELSVARWGEGQAVEMLGHSPAFLDLQAKLEKIARYKEAVLVTGESGVGKEQIAQSLYLLGQPAGHPYISVNCPQFQEGNLTVSELFGHRKGSFTGAVADRTGAFEEAHGGTIFLDEIADLHPTAQAMLLRALATGEFKALGATRTRSVEVRVVAATNRPLNKMMSSGEFRYDLFFRLRHFHVEVPPLRARGDDWRLMLDHGLRRLSLKYGVPKYLSPASERLLERYPWPGNVRQLLGVLTTGYAMADGDLIEPSDLSSQLEGYEPEPTTRTEDLFQQLLSDSSDFWDSIHRAFMERDLNRSQVRAFVRSGLQAAQGNYRQLLGLMRLPESDYQRFMDFLRHHDLKP